MNFVQASNISIIAFILIVTSILAAFVYGTYSANKRMHGPASRRTFIVATMIIIWLTILGGMVKSGFVAQGHTRILFFFALVNVVSISAALSPLGKWLAHGLPLGLLVIFQGFRLPLELVLHAWAEQGTIPSTMTWTGQNFDIVSGLTAIIAAYFANSSRKIAWLANIVGFLLLLNVMRVAILSSPLPFAWNIEPPLQLILYSPYFLIAPVCVGGALFGHIVLTRALLKK